MVWPWPLSTLGPLGPFGASSPWSGALFISDFFFCSPSPWYSPTPVLLGLAWSLPAPFTWYWNCEFRGVSY